MKSDSLDITQFSLAAYEESVEHDENNPAPVTSLHPDEAVALGLAENPPVSFPATTVDAPVEQPEAPAYVAPKAFADADPRLVALGARISRLRQAKGVTEAELGLAIGYSSGSAHNRIRETERGRFTMQLERQLALASVLGVPVSELLKGL